MSSLVLMSSISFKILVSCDDTVGFGTSNSDKIVILSINYTKEITRRKTFIKIYLFTFLR